MAGHNSNRIVLTPNNSSMSPKELHDQWLQQKAEGASHDTASCMYCTQKIVESASATGGAGNQMSDKTHTKEEVDAAIAAAVKPLEAQLSELTAGKQTEETEAKIAAAKAEGDAALAEAQKELDLKIAELEAVKTEFAEFKTGLEALEAEAAEAAALEGRKADRVEKVKEVANYSEERIAERSAGWAAMSDEEFAFFIDDLKTAGVKKSDDTLPGDTKLKSGEKADLQKKKSALSGLGELRSAGIDPRRV